MIVRDALRRLVVVSAIATAVAAGLTAPAPAVAQVEAAATADCDPLTRRHRVAQTVMTGFPTTRMTDRTRRLVRRHAGTVVLLGRNVDNADQGCG